MSQTQIINKRHKYFNIQDFLMIDITLYVSNPTLENISLYFNIIADRHAQHKKHEQR